LTHNKRTMP
ncbi:rhodanese-like domain protein, partial [Vibrio parahaemolyticus VPTS-2010]